MIPLPLKPKIIKEEDNKAVFEIEGCYPGYGITLGNAFRRALLSSLPGTAVTAVKIKGIQHEFSTLPHVTEDVLQIILNLKQVRFKVYKYDFEQVYKLILKAGGEKEVKASHIKTPTGVEIVNKEIHIATLNNKKANLEIEIDVQSGLGYSPIEKRQKEKTSIGSITIDAIFTPIVKVNFEVENMRVGERTDYNRLRFDIETDGSITPKQAFKDSAKILVEQFKIFTEPEKVVISKKEVKEKKKVEKKQIPAEDFSKRTVDQLKLSSRTVNLLMKTGIKTISGLIKKKEETILAIEGMGEKGVKEIKRELSKLGLELK